MLESVPESLPKQSFEDTGYFTYVTTFKCPYTMRSILYIFTMLLLGCHVYGQPGKAELTYTFQPSSQFPVSRLLSTSQVLSRYKDLVNSTIALPRNIPVRFCDCGIPNAYYTQQTHSITICYDYIQYVFDTMRSKFPETDESIANGIAVSVLGHEFGHALIDQLDLATTGKEENAADEFSVIFMFKDMETFYKPAFIGALGWYYLSMSDADKKNASLDSKAILSDVHAPHGERYYNYLSLLCGYNIDISKRTGFVGDDKAYKLPTVRAQSSDNEYRHAVKSWNYLLRDYYKSNVANTTEPYKVETGKFVTQRISNKIVAEIKPSYWYISGLHPPSQEVKSENYIKYVVFLDSNGNPIGMSKKESSTPEIDSKSLMIALGKSKFWFTKTAGMSDAPTGANRVEITFKVSP